MRGELLYIFLYCQSSHTIRFSMVIEIFYLGTDHWAMGGLG